MNVRLKTALTALCILLTLSGCAPQPPSPSSLPLAPTASPTPPTPEVLSISAALDPSVVATPYSDLQKVAAVIGSFAGYAPRAPSLLQRTEY